MHCLVSSVSSSQGAAVQPTSTAGLISSTVAPSSSTAAPIPSAAVIPVQLASSIAAVPVQAEVLGSSTAVTGSAAAASAVSSAAADQVQTAAKGSVPVQSEHSERSTVETAAGHTVKTAAVSSETAAPSVQEIVLSSAAAGNSDLTPGDLDGIAAALAEAQRLLIAPVADSKAVTIQHVHTTSGFVPLPVTKEDRRPGIR